MSVIDERETLEEPCHPNKCSGYDEYIHCLAFRWFDAALELIINGHILELSS